MQSDKMLPNFISWTTEMQRALFAALMLLAAPGIAAQFSLGTGFDYSEGDYSGNDNIKVWYFPVTAKLVSGPATFKLTVPYVRVEAPSNVTVILAGGDGGGVSEGEIEDGGSGGGSSTTPSITSRDGLGDIVLSLAYNLWDDRARPFGLDVGGKIKFGTADTAKGLGTGKNDYTLYAEAFRQWDNRLDTYINIGYRWYGDTATTDYRDAWLFSTGLAYPMSQTLSLGLDYGYRQKLLANLDAASDVTAYLNYKFTSGYKLQAYAVKGFTPASPDWGGGMTFTVPF